MGKPQRDRVTIDLRGLREPLHARALANQMTPAALVRQAEREGRTLYTGH